MPIFDNVMRNIFRFFLLFLSLFCLSSCSAMMDIEAEEDYEKTTLVRVGDMAPDFTVELLSGEQITLSKLQGNTILLVLFDSTCADCKIQLSLLNNVIDRIVYRNCSVTLCHKGQ